MNNPFENNIVCEPRCIEKAVSGLNDSVLASLVQQFELLGPDFKKLNHAQFVVSPQPGSGKSHLIGRLFQRLNQRATLIYLRPFEDAATCWKSILLKMTQELGFADNVKSEHQGPKQIEVFAHGVIKTLVHDAIQNKLFKTPNPKLTLHHLKKTDVKKFQTSLVWQRWIRNNYPKIAQQFQSIKLNASLQTWLGVLSISAYFPSEYETCLDWLRGSSLDVEDAKKIGIKPRDIPSPDMSSGACNELCKDRIADFCQLAAFFRPFVFCFDQTENYGKDINLVRTMGTVIQVLTDQIYNQMTVITANRDPWHKAIQPYLEGAHRDRLSNPLELESLNQKQALQLMQQRLTDKHTVIDISPLFKNTTETTGVRKFLQYCSRQWQGNIKKPVQKADILQYYNRTIKRVREHSRSLVFDPNIFYWLLHEVAQGLAGLSIEKYKSLKGYFSLVWKFNQQEIYFGFESGFNWNRWQAIAREAGRFHTAHGAKAVFLRTPEMRKIPGSQWKSADKLAQAQKQYLHILSLNQDETIYIYAAYDLYMEVKEGSLPFQLKETLQFLCQFFHKFWEKVKRPLSKTEQHHHPMAIIQSISVSDLKCACLDPEWCRQWCRGEQPSSRSFAPPGSIPVYGILFHKIVENFVKWITTVKGTENLKDYHALWFEMYHRFAKKELTRLTKDDKIDSVYYLTQAFKAFCQQMIRLRTRTHGFQAWHSIYLQEEFRLQDINLKVDEAHFFISGQLDAIRTHPDHDLEIVDYKLSQGANQQHDLLQIAIYAKLLQIIRPKLTCCGMLEYYNPELQQRPVSVKELQQIFQERVAPVLAELCGQKKILEFGERIKNCYASFKLKVEVTGKVEAPQLTRYKIKPAPGVKVISLASRANDLQVDLNLKEPPLIEPAQGCVTIDIPKEKPDTVLWHKMITTVQNKSYLAFPVGIGMDGQILMADFADPNMCHALVAGASGSGKSEFLKSMTASLLHNNNTKTLQITIIDPKILSFGSFSNCKFLTEPIITDLSRAVSCLKNAVIEMDARYQQLSQEGFENLSQRFQSGKKNLPFYLIVFDEFADLILAGREQKKIFETLVSRLAAKGRAAGIHLVLATQRPDRKIVTGLIKSNLPLKICFKVTSTANSQIVLDQNGGESLLGRGDLLCDCGKKIERAQSPYISQKELLKLISSKKI